MIRRQGNSFRVIQVEDRYRLVTRDGALVEKASDFLNAVALRGLSPLTVRAYCFDLLALHIWLDERQEGESRTVEDLHHRDFLDFVRFQQERHASPASINRRLVVAGLYYIFLTGTPIGADTASTRGVSLPSAHYKGRGRDRDLGLQRIAAVRHRALRVKTPRRVVEPLTGEQARHLLGSFKRYRDIAIAYIMLLCGLRSCEVLALELGDVDFNERYLRVLGKGNKQRILPLPTILLGYVRDYLRLERPSFCPSRALFVVMQGRRRGYAMTPDGLRSLFRHRRRDETIENANPHRLRHTFGADMARAGVRLPILQRMMGHEDSKMTLHYINLSMTDVAAEFERAAKEIHKRYTEE